MGKQKTISKIISCFLLSALLLFLLPLIPKAHAHAYSASYTTLYLYQTKTEMTFAIDELSAIELSNGDVNHNGMLEQEEFDAVKDRLLTVFKEKLTLKINGEPTEWTQVDSLVLDRNGEGSKLRLKVVYPPANAGQPISLIDNLYTEATTNYVNLLTVNYGSQKSTAAFSKSDRTWGMLLTENEYSRLKVDSQQPSSEEAAIDDQTAQTVVETEGISGWYSFFKLGMNHILGGYDHLLFLFSLLIARQTFKQYATMITAFTIAHSLTLSLTVLGWINVPPMIVEPAIALSICYVAFDNIVNRNVKYRWVLTFVFGLIHGMGFADILKEMDIPKSSMAVDLISFNLGIEAVQITIVAVILPLLYLLHRWKFSRRVVIAGSSVALLLGGIWLMERLIELS
ncbi:HupE/UreJ family protein [Cohnella soli]|uniref:HupE/UreJ family protein n=1 Tax=Cohnella soli TaxID=425005 RepID=A0ABW0HNH5_9BACL